MARNEMPDREMEERLRKHFAEEAEELRAPDNLWERIEGRLGEQDPPRFALLRGGAAAIGGMPWIPAAAAAVLVVGVGLGAWALAGSAGDSGDDDDSAPVAASDSGEVQPVATQAAATEAAVAEAEAAEAPAEEQAAAATEAAATQAAVRAAATEVAAEEAAVQGTPEPTPAPQAEAEAEETPEVDTRAHAITRDDDAEADDADDEVSVTAEPGDEVADDAAAEPAADDMADDAMAEEAADMDYAEEEAAEEEMADEMAADSSVARRGGGPAEPAEESPPQPQRPSDTTFQDYDRTVFIDTSTDAVSTFSLDTDRTSYFLALTWAGHGYTVDPDSVRAEEWVNSFDYEYAGPSDDSRFAISSDLVRHPLDRDWHLSRVAFQAPDVRDDVPLNVTLVLDASGSMAWGNRVAIARAAAEAIRESLGADDRIAVVHFTTDVLHRYTVEHSSPDDGAVVQSIANLAAHESTNVQAGLNLGVQLADEARRERPNAYHYIILMSDGVANVDATDPFAILESAPDADSRNPLRLITIGVGIENYNDVLLEQLAQHGNGWYRYLDTSEQAQALFARANWVALSTPFADQARAQVTWDPAVVKEWRIVGYENRITPDHTFVQDRKEFAELPSGTATTVFYELILHEGVNVSEVLGSVEVRWVDPASGASMSQTAQISGRTDAGFEGADHHLRLGAIVGLAADRYSSLSPQVENAVVDYAGIHDDLRALQGALGALDDRLGSVQAYRDFSFLLDHLTAAAAEQAPSSGYSQ